MSVVLSDKECISGPPKQPLAPDQPEAPSESSQTAAEKNRRRCERFKLSLPTRVVGHDRKTGKWHEVTETINVSRTGLRLRLRRRVRHGTVLYLTLPLPWKLRQHGHAEPTYNVYALVRQVEPPKKGMRTVGLEFYGEYPPPGYLEKPWTVYRTQKWTGIERRRKPRDFRAEAVWLEYLNEALQVISQEGGRTENVSRSGARICVMAPPAEFDLVKVIAPDAGFESLAILTNRHLEKDGFERLCVQFVEREWPV